MDWNTYFFQLAHTVAQKSKDTTQVGAILVSPEGSVILTAYNGPPRGVRDTPARLERPAKYLYASHAEANLIAFAARHGIRTHGCSVYVTHQPCAGCARTLIQAGIAAVHYDTGTTSMSPDEFAAGVEMFREAGVKLHRRLAGVTVTMTDDSTKFKYKQPFPF